MAQRTPSDIARDKILTQKILRDEGYFRQVAKDNADAKAAQLESDAASGRLEEQARYVASARHAAAMSDFKSGNALDRAVEGYRVKRAIADLAMADGRRPTGEILPVVKEVPAAVGATPAATDSAPTDSATQ